MAVRQSRGRYVVELQQGGIRVFRRLPAGITQAQARELETKIRRELFDAGPLGKRPDITLPAAIQLWLENNHRKDQRKAQSEARQWAEFVKGKLLKEAPEVAAEAVRAWRATGGARQSAGQPAMTCIVKGSQRGRTAVRTASSTAAHGRITAVATVNRRLCVLKAAAKYAWKRGWIQDNVSGRISLLPERNQREIYLTTSDVKRLAKASIEPVGSAIMIAAYTGLRASELLALTSSSVRNGSLTITQSKTGKPRVVPFSSLVRPYLSALPLGLSYWQLHKEFDRAKVKAGLPHIRFHDLRHTCASWLINSGVDLYTVGKILGHAGPATTARYAHLADKTLKRAMARLK